MWKFISFWLHPFSPPLLSLLFLLCLPFAGSFCFPFVGFWTWALPFSLLPSLFFPHQCVGLCSFQVAVFFRSGLAWRAAWNTCLVQHLSCTQPPWPMPSNYSKRLLGSSRSFAFSSNFLWSHRSRKVKNCLPELLCTHVLHCLHRGSPAWKIKRSTKRAVLLRFFAKRLKHLIRQITCFQLVLHKQYHAISKNSRRIL